MKNENMNISISSLKLKTKMTVLPKQKLSINKKIDFSNEGNVEIERNEISINHGEYELEDETIDFTTLEESYLQPVVQEPTTTTIQPNFSYENSTNNNSSFHQNVFNQKKTQEKDYQEMLIVRQEVDFDERAFRDSYIRTESEIILKMRKDIDALYDWLDRLVADLTKSLNTFQETEKATIEDKLRAIRENSVRADSINRSIQNFLSSIQHAYQHTFAAFLDNE
jgi:hypothetical protein